jgi:hypothetical protein
MGLIDKDFVIMNRDFINIHINSNKSITLNGESILTNSMSVKGKVLYKDQSQWRMILYDSFNKNNTSTGWSFTKTSECNYYKMLGGVCQLGPTEIEKEIENLPPHTMVKIEGLYHFIGNWDHHTGYLKVDLSHTKPNPQIIWAKRCKNQKSPIANVKLCQDIEVCKIASQISATFSHVESRFKLIFGSSLEGNPCERSYGISDIKIFVR